MPFQLRHTNIYERKVSWGRTGLDPKHNRSHQFYTERICSHVQQTVIHTINKYSLLIKVYYEGNSPLLFSCCSYIPQSDKDHQKPWHLAHSPERNAESADTRGDTAAQTAQSTSVSKHGGNILSITALSVLLCFSGRRTAL